MGVPSSSTVSFLLNGAPRRIDNPWPTTTVLEYLRTVERATGTKEGCAEGDCGACTVVVGTVLNGRMRYRAINSCIAFLPQVHETLVITVEGLSSKGAPLHPVQQAFVDEHASQCGFCTPGFVMALFAFHHADEVPDEDTIHDVLAGNLCRCTGYRPIVDAARHLGSGKDSFSDREQELVGTLNALSTNADLEIEHGDQSFLAPTTVDGLAAALAAHPDAFILSGGTDLGLLVTKHARDLQTIVSTTRVGDLRRIVVEDERVTIGASVTYTDALPAIEADYPSFATLIRRIGSRQIRNLGTVGGNIANASPIGDTPPPLLALGATVSLRSANGQRALDLDDFFLDYRKTALRPGEFVEHISLPRPTRDQIFRVYKISKRFDQDIATVCVAINVTLAKGRIAGVRIACGGVAATPKRALNAEEALLDRPWTKETVTNAITAIERDFTPIDDFRGTAAYRTRLVGNLLRRFFFETSGAGGPVEVSAL